MRSRNSPLRRPVRARNSTVRRDERVGVGAGGLQQLGRRAVVEEAGQRLVEERQVAGEHAAAAPAGVVAVPFGEPVEKQVRRVPRCSARLILVELCRRCVPRGAWPGAVL